MPVPKRKRSRARRDSRFADKGLTPKAFSACKNCTEPLAPHQVCAACGFYKGAKVMVTKSERSAKRLQTRSKEAERKQARAAQAEPQDQGQSQE
jgi:large subunit ribosomal protein L32